MTWNNSLRALPMTYARRSSTAKQNATLPHLLGAVANPFPGGTPGVPFRAMSGG
jgi:hypothetical protein